LNPIVFLSNSEEETSWLGEKVGEFLPPRFVIFLNGTLGAGKTGFVKSIATGLGIDPSNVQSPTFNLLTPHRGRLSLVHIDAYRIQDLDEAEQLGCSDWLEIDSVLAIEWANRIEPALPAPDLRIEIEPVDASVRRIEISAHSVLGQQLLKQLSDSLPMPDDSGSSR